MLRKFIIHPLSYSNKKISVLILPRWYPYQEDPMYGLFVERHVRSLPHTVEVKVLFIMPLSGLKPGITFRHHQVGNVETLYAHYNNQVSRYKLFNLLYSSCCYLTANLKGYRMLYPGRSRPDLCHVHVLTRPAILAFLLNLRYRTPYIITEHWSRYYPHLQRYKGFIRKWGTTLIARRAASITAVSDQLRQAMQRWNIRNRNFILLPNIVDTEIFRPFHTASSSSARRVIVHISTFDDHAKNLTGIVRTIEKLVHQRQDFLLRLIGDGVDMPLIKEMSDRMGLTHQCIEFTGLATEDEIARHLNEASFLLLFSNYENQPVVILESFSCGTPVLATRVGGIPGMVSPSRGMLITPGDENQLLQALKQMIENSDSFDREEIRNYAVANFSTQVVRQQLLDLYEKALREKTE